MEPFLAVADLAAGQHDKVRAAVTRLDEAASTDGYDRFILNWTGWMPGSPRGMPPRRGAG